MKHSRAGEAGRIIHDCWAVGSVVDELPENCRPATLEAGYEVQRSFVQRSGETVVG